MPATLLCIVLNLDVGLVDAPVCCLQDGHCVLCYCIRGVSGNTKNCDPILCRCLGIDVVETCAAKKDQLDAALIQDLDDFTGSLVIDEDADCVIPFCQICRLSSETAVEILDVYIICALSLISGELTKEYSVIILGAKERHLEDFALPRLGSDICENFLNLSDRFFLVRSIGRDHEC